MQVGLVEADGHVAVDLADAMMPAEVYEGARVDPVAVGDGVSVHVPTARTYSQCDNHSDHTCVAAYHMLLCAPRCEQHGHPCLRW